MNAKPSSACARVRHVTVSVAAGLGAILALNRPVLAADTDLEAIRHSAEVQVRSLAQIAGVTDPQTLHIEVAPLDARLRLAACDHPLQAFVTGDAQLRHQTTVGVRCEGSVRWTIYTSVIIDSQIKVLIAKRALARDAELSGDDFSLGSRQVAGLGTDYVSDATTLGGQRLRAPLAVGDPLPAALLSPPVLIHRGQEIELLAQTGGIEVRMAAVALTDGHAAERIRVQNLSSQRVVEGIVRSDHVVEAPL